MPLPPNLCYTIAIDKPGEDVHRRMARLLVTSLIRTGWHGKIVVFHNNPVPVMPEGHPDVEERMIEQEASVGFAGITRWKYRVRNRLDVSGFGKVVFLDCDIIALRDVNHLMLGTWEIYTAPEPGRIVELPFNGYLTDDEFVVLADRPGINSGTIGLRAAAFGAAIEYSPESYLGRADRVTSSYRRRCASGPCGYERSSSCADRARADPCGGADPGSFRSQPCGECRLRPRGEGHPQP